MRATRGAGGPLGTPVRTPEILWHDSSGFVGIGWATWHFRRLDCRGALSFVYRRGNPKTFRVGERGGEAGDRTGGGLPATAHPPPPPPPPGVLPRPPSEAGRPAGPRPPPPPPPRRR